MTAFATAAAVLFRDPNLSVAVLWGPGGIAPAVAMRGIRRRPDDVGGFGASRPVVETFMLDLPAADASAVERGDAITVGGTLYRVAAAPRTDRERLVVTVELVFVPPAPPP